MREKIRQIELLLKLRKQRVDESSRQLEIARQAFDQESGRLSQLMAYQSEYADVNTAPAQKVSSQAQPHTDEPGARAMVSHLSNASRFMTQLEGAKQLQTERLKQSEIRYKQMRDRWSQDYQSHMALSRHLDALRGQYRVALEKEDDRRSLEDWLASR